MFIYCHMFYSISSILGYFVFLVFRKKLIAHYLDD